MNVKQKAKIFAINAHNGQVRKSEPQKPLVIHSIGVGNLLENYGLDDNLVAAGYLHDVVEDTSYTLGYIVENFGTDIASLVSNASEPDKSLPWKERKLHTIELAKKLPLRDKLLICADKINNLESLLIKFEKTGKRDFTAFKEGEEKQKWYYTKVYESLILNEDENHPMFKRLKSVIDKLFYEKENTFLKNFIFADRPKYYEKLKRLHAQKQELKMLSEVTKPGKPFVIEFAGTPRTGKTTIIKKLEEFFRKGGFKVKVIEEFTTSKYFNEEFRPKMKKLSLWDYHMAIAEEVNKQLEEAICSDFEIILIDRSVNDRQIWNYRRYVKSNIPYEVYLESKDKYMSISKLFIDFLVVTYADTSAVLKRDYKSSITLDERRFINFDNINEYNASLHEVNAFFGDSVYNYMFLDTTTIKEEEVVFKVARQIMFAINDYYLDNFIEEINQYIDTKK